MYGNEPNLFTTLIAVLILVLIVLAIRYILKHGHYSDKELGCSGCCTSCASRCAAPKHVDTEFDKIMAPPKPHAEREEKAAG